MSRKPCFSRGRFYPANTWNTRESFLPSYYARSTELSARFLNPVFQELHALDPEDAAGVAGTILARRCYEAFLQRTQLHRSNIDRPMPNCASRLWGGACAYPQACPGCAVPTRDHVGMFDDADDRPAALVWHPYRIDDRQKAELSAFAKQHRLNLSIEPGSWYSPGQTFLVILSRGDLVF